jgi:hypothetical protein
MACPLQLRPIPLQNRHAIPMSRLVKAGADKIAKLVSHDENTDTTARWHMDAQRVPPMRLVACLTLCFAILTNAAQRNAQASSDPPAYCVNRSADFYPYRGDPCKNGYQVGPGNCRKTEGHIVAVSKKRCVAMGGTVQLPFEGGRPKTRSNSN